MKPSGPLASIPRSPLSRRAFLKVAALGLGGLALRPWPGLAGSPAPQALLPLAEFPQAERLGRAFGAKTPLKARADIDSATVGELGEDEVVPWLSETVGSRPLWHNKRFVETGRGFVYAPNLQPVRNLPNPALKELPNPGGMWAEVTVPYVDLVLQNPPGRAPWLAHTPNPRLYYSQVMWIDAIRSDEQGRAWYRVNERYGTFGDIFWAAAEAFKPLTDQDLAPINPQAADKRVEVNLLSQTLSCYEGSSEVYFCQVSTGGKYDKEGNPSDKWSTPVGPHNIWRKLVSVHMVGGTVGSGYDYVGISFTSLFSGEGVAIHSTFWHNNFGQVMSHGCVNAQPEDAKWVFRWTSPAAPYDRGDITISGDASTRVVVMEG